jgi:hypothetical protein
MNSFLLKNPKNWLLFLAIASLFFACKPEEPIEGEEEIDTVKLTIGTQEIFWRVDDTTTPTITLNANETVNATLEFLNEAENEDVTTEIREEDDEHLVCFDVSGANLTITATDSDGTHPVGLASEWTTGDASTGTLILELRHQPGEKDGTCTPGDTDVQADFEVVVQ